MKKYIDAEKAKNLIEKKYEEFIKKSKMDCPLQYRYMADGLIIAKSFIDYLQQEESTEVDLEKEIQKKIYAVFFDLDGIAIKGTSAYACVDDMVYIARHFYELGINARKED